ncbi:response regulator transcription factor [Clostridium ihumii]|uniref:response regulator transcription factor n=1 Tax=Clostridium ihumii TaxID=1470356 RepID=UPI00058F3AB3|nr:response regulator transcription factor [Clostridium ihumii]
MKNKVLIIEDEKNIVDILYFSFRKENLDVRYAYNGREGLDLIDVFKPDLIILDVILPDMSGFDICKTVNFNYRIPILMLTARNDIEDKILGLELGADDYITKPFNVKEVIIRAKVILRRIEKFSLYYNLEDDEIIKVNDDIIIYTKSRVVKKRGEEIKLKPREYDLLLLLSKNKEKVFSRENLLESVWTLDFEGDIRTVDVHVQRLRKKLDDKCGQSIITTIFGVGYKMR